MRIFNFWNRPIATDKGNAIWHEGGITAIQIALAIILPAYIWSLSPSREMDIGLCFGSITFLLLALGFAYLLGGIYATIFQLLLRPLWRHLGYVGSVAFGIYFASLISWFTFNSLFQLVDTHLDPYVTFLIGGAHAAFIAMSGRGAAKLYDLWHRLYPTPQKRTLP